MIHIYAISLQEKPLIDTFPLKLIIFPLQFPKIFPSFPLTVFSVSAQILRHLAVLAAITLIAQS